MNYVEVLVGDNSYHGKGPLTYICSESLKPGQLVIVPLRTKEVLGMVSQTVKKPDFVAKSILRLIDAPALPAQQLELLNWIQAYYPSPLGIITQLFLPKSIPKKFENFQFSELPKTALPPLTQEQYQAIQAISPSGVSLLHGETGSGKTRVYIELAKKSLFQNKSAIILTPEIGLTSQLAYNFKQVFGDRVVVLHSQLTAKVRQELWMAALQSAQPLVLIGPRSTLFTPVKAIGLIVVDEAHEGAYKQDQAPYYLTTRVASKLGELSGCPVVLGSATPSVVDYFLAEQKKRPIVRMKRAARPAAVDQQITFTVVDLKEKSEFNRNPYLSDKLIQAVNGTLARHEQILLFLNRRGTARIIFCEFCGWQAVCPHCDLPLIYHGDTHQLRCHTCTFKMPSPASCPVCNHSSVVFKTIGTKAVSDDIAKLFPKAKIQRFDTDNSRSERLEQHFEKIKRGDIDIIVGTQTLAKGLDLPKLGLIGVIVADTSLYFPDFSAQERTYQLVSQVLGRIGRGHRSGAAIIQTYMPKNSILQAILAKDWHTFYTEELKERQQFTFPPFCYLLKLTCKRATQNAAEKAATQFAQKLAQEKLKISIDGPSPAFHEKVANKYHWQLVIKSKQRNQLLAIIENLPSGWGYDIDPLNLL